jgi:nitroreductase
MDLTAAIYGRRSIRAFTREPMSQPVLEELIAAAVQAPSAMNTQPWTFTVVRNPALLDHISEAAKAHMLAAQDQPAPPHLRAMLEAPDFHIFYHAPALIVISATTGDWAVEDAALAAENLMLAAHGRGLGSCWIGFAQRWLRTAEGKQSIDVPGDLTPIAPIIIGHPAAAPAPVPRQPAKIRWLD